MCGALLLAALVGCGSGCDGERAQKIQSPRAPGSGAVAIPGVQVAAETAVPVQVEPPAPRVLGALDAASGTLDGLFTGLDAAERGDPGGRVLLLFFGDSHTAGDSLTSRIRVAWQARFGDAGRGLVAAGHPPTRHYYQRDVKYGTDGVWKAMVGGARHDTEPFGIGGIRVTGQHKGAQLWVETCSDCAEDGSVGQFEILYYAAPDHGVLRYKVDDGAWQTLATKTSAIEPPHPARQVVPVPDGHHRLTLEHGGGGTLDLFGVVMERMRPGVIVDSLGVVGRRLGSLRSWDWSIIGEQLATRDPRLVVLQYGTNEADDPDLNLDDLAKYYDETILRIRAAAPTASILILGPPDMGVREAGKACDRMKAKAGSDAAVIPECQWRTPAILGEIIAVEHAAALRNHVAFFDTFAAMGGGDQMDTWFNSEPRAAYKDRVHFTDLGYQRWADSLSGALLDAYERWRAAHQLPASKPAAPPPPAKPSDALLPGPVPVGP
ncbi:MAG: GDSL-type esterase/lipase family protein [Acidobacteriota bacterium]